VSDKEDASQPEAFKAARMLLQIHLILLPISDHLDRLDLLAYLMDQLDVHLRCHVNSSIAQKPGVWQAGLASPTCIHRSHDLPSLLSSRMQLTISWNRRLCLAVPNLLFLSLGPSK
jgi:hypothetical protein